MLRTSCFHGDKEFGSNLWFKQESFDDSDMQALVDAVANRYATIIADGLSNNVVVSPFKAVDMRAEDGGVVYSPSPGNAGEDLNDILPLAVCVVMTLRTAKRGRSHRGRMYLSGWCENLMNEDGWASGPIDAAIAFGEALIAEMGAIGWTWGVHSGMLNGVARDPQIITPITSVEVRSIKPGIQRLRIERA